MQRRTPTRPDKTFAEFFAGIGLMRLGLERGGWRIAFANDIDREKEMYRANFPDANEHFLLGDIHAIPPSDIPSVVLATASFPCNDLSLAGARDGLSGKQSSAFWGFIRLLEGMRRRRPPLVLIENVTGFLTSRGGMDFSDAMTALNRLGYSVDPFILEAVNWVPQSRQRLFVAALLENPFQAGEINERFFESEARPAALADFIFFHPDIRWRIRELPSLPKCKLQLKDILENLADEHSAYWN